MSKLLPFLSKPQEKIIQVGREDIGILYLLKKDGITPNENPVDFQKDQKEQQKFAIKLQKDIKREAKERGVPAALLRKKVFGMDVEEKSAETGDSIKAEIDGEEETLYDYLSDETLGLMLDMQKNKREIAIRAASYMVAKRTAYPVELRANVTQGQREIPIKALNFVISKDCHIRFGSQEEGFTYLKVVSPCFPNASPGGALLKVEPAIANIKEGAIGFLCQDDGTALQIGYSEWSEEDTKDNLGEELIGMLYSFYMKEAGEIEDSDESPDGREDDESEASEGNLLTDSNSQSTPPVSSGETSSLDSSTSELEMNDSATKTLENSLVG